MDEQARFMARMTAPLNPTLPLADRKDMIMANAYMARAYLHGLMGIYENLDGDLKQCIGDELQALHGAFTEMLHKAGLQTAE